jgi:hypothetical protein
VDGQKQGSVVYTESIAQHALIDGFTIQNGSALTSITNAGIFNAQLFAGGGIRCINASPFITHCIIRNNAAGYGGGIACLTNSNTIISNNKILGNTAFKNDASSGFGGGIYLPNQF